MKNSNSNAGTSTKASARPDAGTSSKVSALNRAAMVGDKMLTVLASIIAILLITYSAYAVEDSLVANHNAFVGEDLLQYRPNVEKGERVTFDGLRRINKDVTSWLTVYDTNINYPVLQGKDDLYYARTDIYGKASLTGAIYLSALNSPDFSDQYNMIYGHHMDNGAMFGQVDDYLEASFLDGHRTGVLITPDSVYDLDVFASMPTDAYEDAIYAVERHNAEPLSATLDYVRANAKVYREPTSAVSKLVVLSTCMDTETSGRAVIFASLTRRSDYDPSMFGGLTDRTDEIGDDLTPLAGPRLHELALLNLVCMLFTLYMFLPLDALLAKFGQRKWIRRTLATDADERVRHYRRRVTIASVVELLICVASVLLFVLKEDIFAPITIVDRYTPVMILLLAACWFVDVNLMESKYDNKLPWDSLGGKKVAV